MFLSSDELRLFHFKTKYYSTKKLHSLEYYLRHNNKTPVYKQMHKMVELILTKRGEKTFQNQRIEHIKYLNKCWSLSNPMGRLSANIIGYFYQFVDNK